MEVVRIQGEKQMDLCSFVQMYGSHTCIKKCNILSAVWTSSQYSQPLMKDTNDGCCSPTEWGCGQTAPPFRATGAAVTATAPAEPRTIRPEWCLGPAALIKWPLTGAQPTVRRNGASPPLAAPAASITPTGRPSSTATFSVRHPAPPAMPVWEIIKRWRLRHSLRWANVFCS